MDERQARSRAEQTDPDTLTPAGLWPRVKAFGGDYLFIAAYLSVLAGGAWGLRRTALRDRLARLYRTPASAQLATALLLDLPVMLYFALFESSAWQATPGKRWIGLRVVTERGQRVGLPRALARIALKFLPWEIAHTSIWQTPGWPRRPQPTTLNLAGYLAVYALLGVYIATLSASDARQTLYDRLTRTRVVYAVYAAPQRGWLSARGARQ